MYCDDCGDYILEDESYSTKDGNTICERCYEDDYSTCEDCGEIVPNDEMTLVDDGNRYVCEHCRDGNYEKCEWCGEWYSRRNMYETYDEGWVCNYCAENHYYCCSECNRMVSEEQYVYSESRDEYFCPDCAPEEGIIYGYHDFDDFRPLRTSADDVNTMTFGFELEVSGSEEYAEEFLSYFDDEVILMHDGSIKDGGFEIITMPMTANFFYETFLEKFKKGLQFLSDKGFNGHNYGGLHIHISKPSMPVVAQLSELMYHNSYLELEVWKKLTQRKEEELHWCQFNVDTYDFDEIIKREHHSRVNINGGRYVALNYDSRTNTYEFRIFNSNLRIERFLKNFEIVQSLLKYCEQFKNATIPFVSMREYLKFVENNKIFYQNLYEFIQLKNIKLNEVERRRVANSDIEIEIPY